MSEKIEKFIKRERNGRSMRKLYSVPALTAALIAASPGIKTGVGDTYNSIFNRRGGIEQVVQTPENRLEEMIGGVAYGQSVDKISVEEYYKRAKPVDEVAQGARIAEYKVTLGQGFGFIKNEWTDFYINNKDGKGELMRKYFKDSDSSRLHADGKIVSFDFERFENFIKENYGNFDSVVFYDNGFVIFSFKSKDKKIIIPINKSIVHKIRNLW